MNFRSQFSQVIPWKRRTYPSKKKDAEPGNAGETPHAGSMGEGRGLRSAWRVEGTLQTSIQLCTTLTDGEIHNALHNKKKQNS
jgi:hypothetical protein